MTTTESYTIHEIINKIGNGQIQIPIFQRRFKWKKEQVVKLFSTILEDNPFGAISVVKTTNDYIIFPIRPLFKNFKDNLKLSKQKNGKIYDESLNPLYLVLDGQQRLQSLYLGLTSDFDDTKLCFNKLDGQFKYLNEQEIDDNIDKYIIVENLYNDFLEKKIDYVNVANIYKTNNDTNKLVRQNIFKFYYHFFYQKRIVLFLVEPSRISQERDKLKMFELFKRLNTGGVNLNIYDICESKLKAFNPQFEELFSKLEKEFNKQSYPFNYPFKWVDSSQFYPHHKSEVWIKIICSCFIKDIHIGWLLNDSFEHYINNILKESFTVNSLFEFICLIFKFFRTINLQNAYTPSFIYYAYSLYSQRKQTNVKNLFVGYFKEIFKQYFIDEQSLELFTFKYLILNYFELEEEKRYVFHCTKLDNYYEIQVNDKHIEGLYKFSVEINHKIVGKTKDNIRLKYNNETIDKELNVLSNNFSNNWRKKTNSIQKKWNNYLKQRYE
ncbi:MAG: DUF262 domain-containing protein [Bacteroidales bacterium]|nr:DUF262 domain-containing protein [Bacteroidales bacterium]